jgi:hypothetical protein
MGKKDCHRKQRSRSCSSSSSSSSDSESDFNEEHLRCLYKDLKQKLLKDKSLQVAGSDAYGSFYSLDGQQVNAGEPVVLQYVQTKRNIDLGNNKQHIYVRRDGMYMVTIHVAPDGASQWTLFVNNLPQFDRVFGTYNSSGQVTITYMIALKANDAIAIRNYVSASPTVYIPQIVGGVDPGANLELVIEKIAPYPEKKDECKEHKEHKEYCDKCNHYIHKADKNHKDCESSESDKKEHHLKKKFCILKKWMKCDPALILNGVDVYGSFYSTLLQTVAVDAPVVYDKNQYVNGLTHTLGTGDITVSKDGIYVFVFIVNTTQACQFTLFVNGVPEQTTTAGINKGANILQLRQQLELKAGDIVSVRNHVSAAGTITISQNAGGTLTGNNVEFIVSRISVPVALQDNCPVEPACVLERDCRYKLFKQYLLEDKCLELKGCESYYLVDSTSSQKLNLEDTVSWSYNNALYKVYFKSGEQTVKVLESGIYYMHFDLQGRTPSQFTIYINGLPEQTTITGIDSGSGQVSIRQLLELHKGDILSVKNHSSFLNPVITVMNPGGTIPGINAIFLGQRFGPIPKKCIKPPMPPKKP